MNDTSSATVRRTLAAAALVTAALLSVLSVALQPAFPADHAARLAALDHAGARGAVSAVAFLVSQLPLTVALLGLGHLLRPVAPRLSTSGVVLGCVGTFGHTVFGGLSMGYLLMASDAAHRSTYAALYGRIEGSPVMLFALLGLAGTVLGLLLLTIALFRAREVARWVPALLAAFLVLEFVGSGVSAVASDLAGLCLLVAFVALAGYVRRMPVAAWSFPTAREASPERVAATSEGPAPA